jgi:hypothetical protein
MKIKPILRSLILAAVLISALASSAQAEFISVNFNNGATANRISDDTGAKNTRNWTEVTFSAEGTIPLNTSGTVMSWKVKDFIGSKSPVKGVSTGHPDRLYRSQLRTNSFDSDGIQITVTNLPADLVAGGYDVLIYWQDATNPAAPDRVQSFRVNGQQRTLLTKAGAPDYVSYAAYETGMDAASVLEAPRSVNVAIFRNLQAPILTIQTSRENIRGLSGSASNGGIAAFQIIPTGEF